MTDNEIEAEFKKLRGALVSLSREGIHLDKLIAAVNGRVDAVRSEMAGQAKRIKALEKALAKLGAKSS